MALIPMIFAAALAFQGGPSADDPAAWWGNSAPRTPVEADPFRGRRPRKGETPIPIDNGVEPLLYRLWNLVPLQSQLVRRGEIIVEVWARPARSVRQAVSRVTLRSDGRVFLQARAGLGCCMPQILRRIDIDAELPRDAGAALRAAAADPVWTQPRAVEVDYGGGAVAAVCIDGVDFDVTLVVPGRSVTLHRACDDAEVGSAGLPLRAALAPALGRDPRFDFLFRRGGTFEAEAAAYQALVSSGGRLRPASTSRPQPPPVAVVEDDAESEGIQGLP